MTHHRIPQHARITHEGKQFTIYQWDQELFDGTSAVFERAIRPDSVQVIPVKDGKLLVAREQQPDSKLFWGLFGGQLDSNEEPLVAAKRELHEEAGLASEDWEEVYAVEFTDRLFWRIPYYVARDCQTDGHSHQDAGERIEVVAVDFERFVDILCDPTFRSPALTLHVLKLLRAGTLDDFRKKLGV